MTEGRTYSFPSAGLGRPIPEMQPLPQIPDTVFSCFEMMEQMRERDLLRAYDQQPVATVTATATVAPTYVFTYAATGAPTVTATGGSIGAPTDADGRAEKLLCRLITAKQRKDYQETGHFDVVRGKRVYHIGQSLQVRVRPIDAGVDAAEENWCAFLPNTPRTDTIIAHLLMLRDNPLKLRRMANVTRNQDFQNWGVPRSGLRASVARMLERAGYRDVRS